MRKKILFIQRVVADYRIPFFDLLNKSLDIKVIYGDVFDQKDIRPIKEERAYLKKVRMKYFFGNKLWLHKKLLKSIDMTQVDAVIISPTPRCLTNLILIFKCKFYNIPLLAWGMGEMPGRKGIKKYLHRYLQGLLALNIKTFICYSTKAAKYYQDISPKSEIYVAPNALYFDKCILPSLEFFLEKKTERLKLLFIGRLTPDKGLEPLIDIVLNNKVFNLTIVGSGDDDYVNSLKELAKEGGEVFFLGHKTTNEIKLFINNMDLFVLPCRGGLALNQAMFFGLPAVCSEGDGTEEDLIIDGYTGYRFSDRDWCGLESLLLNLEKDRIKLHYLGLNAHHHIVTNFSLENMALVFVELLRGRDDKYPKYIYE